MVRRGLHAILRPKVLALAVCAGILCGVFGLRPVTTEYSDLPAQDLVPGIAIPGAVPDPFNEYSTNGGINLSGSSDNINGGLCEGYFFFDNPPLVRETPSSFPFVVRAGNLDSGDCTEGPSGPTFNFIALVLNFCFWGLVVWNVYRLASWLIQRRRRFMAIQLNIMALIGGLLAGYVLAVFIYAGMSAQVVPKISLLGVEVYTAIWLMLVADVAYGIWLLRARRAGAHE